MADRPNRIKLSLTGKYNRVIMVRYLIVNADDLGLSRGVNRGIVESYLNGIVTSTTAMVNQPDIEHGIRLVKDHAPRLGMGLHITLTHGYSLLPPEQVPSLVRSDGRFYGQSHFSRVSTLFTAQDLRAEINAQFEHFVDLTGDLPDHLDSHHYAAYLHPVAFEIILDLVAEHHLPLRSARNYLDPAVMKQVFMARGFSVSTIDALAEAIVRVYDSHRHKPRWPDYTERRFYDEGVTFENLHHILEDLPPGVTELICHPGYVDDLVGDYIQPRETELSLLTHPDIRNLVAESDVQCITFAQLPAPTQS